MQKSDLIAGEVYYFKYPQKTSGDEYMGRIERDGEDWLTHWFRVTNCVAGATMVSTGSRIGIDNYTGEKFKGDPITIRLATDAERQWFLSSVERNYVVERPGDIYDIY